MVTVEFESIEVTVIGFLTGIANIRVDALAFSRPTENEKKKKINKIIIEDLRIIQ